MYMKIKCLRFTFLFLWAHKSHDTLTININECMSIVCYGFGFFLFWPFMRCAFQKNVECVVDNIYIMQFVIILLVFK